MKKKGCKRRKVIIFSQKCTNVVTTKVNGPIVKMQFVVFQCNQNVDLKLLWGPLDKKPLGVAFVKDLPQSLENMMTLW